MGSGSCTRGCSSVSNLFTVNGGRLVAMQLRVENSHQSLKFSLKVSSKFLLGIDYSIIYKVSVVVEYRCN